MGNVKQILTLVLFLALVGCGKTDSTALARSNTKPLQGPWANSSVSFDLSFCGFQADCPTSFAYDPTSGCDCVVVLFGTEVSGTAAIKQCVQYGPVNYNCDPNTIWYNYVNSNARLTIWENASVTGSEFE